MRPRHKAAEYRLDCHLPRGVRIASMRPRHKAAEYRGTPQLLDTIGGGFNEAAA